MVKITPNESTLNLQEKAKSKNTQSKYDGDWLKFNAYCKEKHKCSALDVDDLVSAYALTANYMDWLHKDSDAQKLKGFSNIPGREKLNNNPYSIKVSKVYIDSSYKASTIRRILASITYKYRANGYEFDRKNPLISDTISAISRFDKDFGSGQANELLKKDIIKIIDKIQLHKNDNEEQLRRNIRDKALILMGYFSFCRRSELLNMKMEHLTFKEKGLFIEIPYSKTDQIGQGRAIFLTKQNDAYCPNNALKEWLKLFHIEVDTKNGKIKDHTGPLFFKINRYDGIEKNKLSKKNHNKKGSLTDTGFVIILKRRAKDAGIKNIHKISGHSLRIGAISQARMNGVPIHDIMKQTGHRSPQMIHKYTKISDISENSASGKI